MEQQINALKHICICSPQYPTKTDTQYSFVEQLVNAITKQGIQVSVIAPQSLIKHIVRGTELHPKKRVISYEGSADVIVYQPYILSLGQRFQHINKYFLKKAVERAHKQIKERIDAYYGHFWHSGCLLYEIAKENSQPLFVATGESEITVTELYSEKELKSITAYICGVICVSSKNKEESIRLRLTTAEKCIIIPNAVDETIFFQKSKEERRTLRSHYHLEDDDFVVIFVGAFINRKGSNRVSQAIDKIEEKQVYSIFVGAPNEEEDCTPACKNMLFCGPQEHSKLPELLNAADAFVMPTLNEGCCNAIVEALACGLPVISSDRNFNYDILDDTNSILINPENIEELKNAIIKLRDDTIFRHKLAEGAKIKAQTLGIVRRAKNIIEFINSMC